jgi:hypothetical protein
LDLLFKSQNASTWEASHGKILSLLFIEQILIESGTVEVYSPELSEGNNQIAN